MVIDITGYITKAYGNNEFTIKIASDKVTNLSFSDIQVSKEVQIYISPYHYLSDDESEFEIIAEEDEYHRDKVNKCRSLGKALRNGDRVKCSVFIVEQEIHNGVTIQKINKNRKDIKSYADFPLWLYPNDGDFRRLEVDSRESLKFRKQWRYTCINREKYNKITGYTLYSYRDKKWVNKNPKITFPILWWIQVKTTSSNLWKRFTRQENLPKASLIVTIISVAVAIISVAVAIWSLFFKNSNPSP